MPMPPRLLRPRASRATHPEALNWATRVTANGGTVSGTTLAAVSTFCAAIDSAGLRDRFYRLSLFCGDQLAAALVPLYLAESSTASARGNATDTNVNFVSGDYGLGTGLRGNGSTKHLNTGYAANTLAANNSHLSAGILEAQTFAFGDDRTIMGAWNGSESVFEMRALDLGGGVPSVSAFTRFGTTSERFGDSVASLSLAAGNILCAWPSMYRNGVASGATATTSFDFPAAVSVFVFALNFNNTGGPLNRTNARLGYYSIGATMTGSQAAAFSNAINAFYSAVGRS